MKAKSRDAEELRMPVRVVITDQQEVVRTGLISILNESPIEVVGETFGVRKLLQQIGKHKPDLVIEGYPFARR